MWATSIGSTFSHNPTPGERKSGIPDGTEIPAPVRATTDPAPRISSASSATGVPTASFSLELRRALLKESGDPLARILGRKRGGEPLLLGLDPGIELPG